MHLANSQQTPPPFSEQVKLLATFAVEGHPYLKHLFPSTERHAGAADELGVALVLAVIVGVTVTEELGVVETDADELGVGLALGTGQHFAVP